MCESGLQAHLRSMLQTEAFVCTLLLFCPYLCVFSKKLTNTDERSSTAGNRGGRVDNSSTETQPQTHVCEHDGGTYFRT